MPWCIMHGLLTAMTQAFASRGFRQQWGHLRTCGPDSTPDISIVCTVLRLAVCCWPYCSVALPLDDALSYSNRVSVVEAEATTSRPTDDGGRRYEGDHVPYSPWIVIRAWYESALGGKARPLASTCYKCFPFPCCRRFLTSNPTAHPGLDRYISKESCCSQAILSLPQWLSARYNYGSPWHLSASTPSHKQLHRGQRR